MCLCFYDTMRNFWISLPVRRSSIVGPNMTLLSWQTALISATTLAVWRYLEISGSLERFEWALRPDLTLLGALKDKMEGDLKASCKWRTVRKSFCDWLVSVSVLQCLFCSSDFKLCMSLSFANCTGGPRTAVMVWRSRNVSQRHGRAMVPDLSCSSRLRWVPRQSTKIESMQFQNGLSLQLWAQTLNNKAMWHVTDDCDSVITTCCRTLRDYLSGRMSENGTWGEVPHDVLDTLVWRAWHSELGDLCALKLV